MPFKPKLTTEDSKAGEACLMRDGWPVVTNEAGEEIVWNVDRQADNLSAVNDEAKAYRESFEGISKALGITGDVKDPATRHKIADRLGTAGADSTDLERLRKMEAAGDLGDDAEAKISALADERAKDSVEKLEIQLKTSDAERADALAQAARERHSNYAGKVQSGFEGYYDTAAKSDNGKYPKFAEGSRSTFLQVAQQPDANGRTWQWTGRYDDETGQALLVQMEADGKTVRKGADGMEPLTINAWAENDLRQQHGILYRTPKGGPDLRPGSPGARGYHEMSSAEIAAEVDSQA